MVGPVHIHQSLAEAPPSHLMTITPPCELYCGPYCLHHPSQKVLVLVELLPWARHCPTMNPGYFLSFLKEPHAVSIGIGSIIICHQDCHYRKLFEPRDITSLSKLKSTMWQSQG